MADAPLDDRTPQNRTTAAAIGLALLVFAVYAPTLGHPFVQWDDQVLLYENPSYNPPTWHAVGLFWAHPFRNLYQPITFTLWAAIAWLAQTPANRLSPILFHAASITTHAATVVLVFILLRRWMRDVRAAAIGAGFFALHPMLADPVNWASGLYTLLAGGLAGAAVVAFDDFSVRKRWFVYAVATVLFAAACLSKASAVVAIGLAAVVLLFRSSRRWPRRVTVALAAWAMIALPVIAIAKRVQPAAHVADLSFLHRVVIALDATAFYARKVVWPWPMTIDYGRTPDVVLGWLSTSTRSDRIREAMLLAVPIIVSLVALRLRRLWPELLLGWAWFVIALLPVLGLTKFEFQHISTVADRYAALAMIGPAIAMAGATRRWHVLRPMMVVVLITWTIASVAQSTYWRNTRTLMTRAEQINPRSKVASAVLAEMLAKAGSFDAADAAFRRAIANDPGAPTPHFDYGNLCAARGQMSEAITQYRWAIDADPTSAQVRQNLGVALARTSDTAGAIAAFRQAIAIDPNDADAYADLGLVLSGQDEATAAADAYEHALRLNPAQAQAARGLQALETSKDR